ncbi:MAG: exodeoxyribonuclease VII small subunit [Lachnospiraceae bacterium]|nr:exodeoxyribonuclease VII small subunit [Lachnospiraceae bacterium]
MEQNNSLEENIKLLEEIISKMDNDDVSLEESFKLYSEGKILLDNCRGTIDEVEKKLIEINGIES